MVCVVLGVGNVLHSDDGAGPVLAGLLEGSGVCAFDCGTAPENFTGVVRRLCPELVVVVDASLMGLVPGSVRRVPVGRICDTVVGTHMMSLGFLAEYLEDVGCEVVFVGVEPVSLEFGEGLSDVVDAAVRELARVIVRGEVFRVPEL